MSVKSTVKEATSAVKKALRPGDDADLQTDILATLKKEHDEVITAGRTIDKHG